MKLWLCILPLVSLLPSATFAQNVPLAARATRIEVISTLQELEETFGATAIKQGRFVTFYLVPQAKWFSFGNFRAYALRNLPAPVAAEDVAAKHKRVGLNSVELKEESPRSKFVVEERDLPNAYITAIFQGDDAPVNVLIPLTLMQALAEKKPNQAPEPTAAAGRGSS